MSARRRSPIELDIDLPGFKKDEVKVELKDGYLTVSAAKGLDKDEQDKKGRYIRQERYAGTMSRSFYVGEGVKPEDLHAKYRGRYPSGHCAEGSPQGDSYFYLHRDRMRSAETVI